MTDAGFVVAAYAVILGGLGLYAILLRLRVRRARDLVHARRRGSPEPG